MIHLAISPSSIHPPSYIPLTSPTPALRLSTTRDNRHGRRITALRPPIGDLDTLPLISRVISDGAICGGTHDALAANQTVWAEPSAQSPQPLPEGVKGRLRQLLLQYYVQHLMFSRWPITKAGVPDGVVIYTATPSTERLSSTTHLCFPLNAYSESITDPHFLGIA